MTLAKTKMRMILLFFNLLVLLKVAQPQKWDSECKSKWPDCLTGQNLICGSRNCGPQYSGCVELLPDEKFRQGMLDKHNELRNKLASGGDKTGNNEAAANMMALSYDLGLEYAAICNVNHCEMKHDKCRATENFNSAGQNLGMSSKTSTTPMTDEDIADISSIEKCTELVDDWYNEIHSGDFKNVIDNYVYDSNYGHFTAVVWATTTHLGCARAVYKTSKSTLTLHVACNYGLSGNMAGESMYKRGSPCTKCPAGKICNTQYMSLCGESDNKAVNAGENPYRAADKKNGTETCFQPWCFLLVLSVLSLRELW